VWLPIPAVRMIFYFYVRNKSSRWFNRESVIVTRYCQGQRLFSFSHFVENDAPHPFISTFRRFIRRRNPNQPSPGWRSHPAAGTEFVTLLSPSCVFNHFQLKLNAIVDVFICQMNEIGAWSRWKERETKQTKTLQITWPSQEGRSPSTSVLHRLKLNVQEFYLFINFLLLLLLSFNCELPPSYLVWSSWQRWGVPFSANNWVINKHVCSKLDVIW